MTKLSIKDLDLKEKKVLMRVDFNVPLESNLKIADPTRIEETLPSIRYVLEKGGSLILMSHLGRPHNEYDPELSLKPCAAFLEGVLQRPVIMAPDVVGHSVKEIIEKIKPGDIVLLENLRFRRAEEYPEESFAEELASYGDLYINDAFGSAHRKHTSVYTLPKLFPGKAAGGFLLEKEIHFLSLLLENPKRPFYALIGGSKISTKMGVLKSLVNIVDALFIGGGMSFTFLKAQGKEIGNSLFEKDHLEMAKEVLKLAQKRGIPLLLPVDVIAAENISEEAKTILVDIEEGIKSGYMGLDIGPKTIELFGQTLKEAKTILWNGPMGVFELEKFARGTNALAELIGENEGIKIVAGGDSIAAIKAINLQDKMTHISTGGGAALEFLEYGTLPGIEALSNKSDAMVL